MGTDDIREAADEMDAEGFAPLNWLIVAQDRAGNVSTIWPLGTLPTPMLCEAMAAVREREGAPGGTQ